MLSLLQELEETLASRHEIRSAFEARFRPFFAERGFRPRKWNLFEREVNDVVQHIAIGPLSKAHGGFGITGGGFGVRIPAVEAIRGSDRDDSTVGMPLHMIAPGTEVQHEWPVANADEVGLAAREIQAAIERFGFPYLDRMNSMNAVLQLLEADDWHKSFASSQDGRDSVLVYATAVTKSPDEAVELGRRLLENYRGLPYNRSILLNEAIAKCSSPSG